MMPRRFSRLARRASPGFSLLEMMLVVVIIGLLATVVVINIGGQGDAARRGTTVTTIAQVKQALQTYSLTNAGRFPASLDALITAQLLEKVPNDAWRQPLHYQPSSRDPAKPFELISVGKDGQLDTTDDINVWTMGE